MLEPKEVTLTTASGDEKTYIIHKFPAIAGREIVTQYPQSALPKIGDYKTNEALMLKMMAYVAVPMPDGRPPLVLSNRTLVDQHVPEFETLMRLEWALMEYNCSFFGKGRNSDFWIIFAQKGKQLITQILTDLQAPSSPKAAPPTSN